MANSPSSDWSDQHPGGRFTVFEGNGRWHPGPRGHPGHEPPYYLNGYEHEGYEEQRPGTRESDELAHDDGYLPGWGPGPAYPDAEPNHTGAEPHYPGAEPHCPDAEPDSAGLVSLPPADPWDAQDGEYVF